MPTLFARAPIATHLLACLFSALILAGCNRPLDPSGPLPLEGEKKGGQASDKMPTDDELRQALDDALDFTFEKRRLEVNQQAAWQIVHGALAFKRSFLVRADGKDVSAVDYVLSGKPLTGWNLVRGDLIDKETGRYGVRALYEPGTKTGQGHFDQWMGYLSDAGLKLDETIVVEGQPHTIEDYIRQIELDVPRVTNREYTWTLMALTAFRPTNHEWIASDGNTWSIEKLLEIELEYAIDDSPCGGTHRMYGLTIARNRHLASGGKLEGIWQKVDEKIREQVERAKNSLNADGSLSAKYFRQPAIDPDITEWMASSGHVFEFLAEALDKEQLQEPWIKLAAWRMCGQFKKTKPIDVECAKLFHAAHGLVLYREKVFGPRTFPAAATATSADAAH